MMPVAPEMPTTIRCRRRFSSFTSLSMAILSSTHGSERRLSPCNHVTFECGGTSDPEIDARRHPDFSTALGPEHGRRSSNFFKFLRRGFLWLSFYAHVTCSS